MSKKTKSHTSHSHHSHQEIKHRTEHQGIIAREIVRLHAGAVTSTRHGVTRLTGFGVYMVPSLPAGVGLKRQWVTLGNYMTFQHSGVAAPHGIGAPTRIKLIQKSLPSVDVVPVVSRARRYGSSPGEATLDEIIDFSVAVEKVEFNMTSESLQQIADMIKQAETRLGKRLDGIEKKLDGIEKEMKAGFAEAEKNLRNQDAIIAGIDRKVAMDDRYSQKQPPRRGK